MRNHHPAGLRLVGDITPHTIPALSQALTELLIDACEVHLDLSQLEFIDVPGLTLLLATAERLQHHGRLVLHDLPAHLTHILRLTGWDATPGLELTDT